ncbi:MAG: hypothetical protein KJ875_04485 [Alphaproteobacteria bacterium]|nr:hypothetical protein [Alphaproteobacteria bacterium]MBU1573874.1 hypothetical protein [Alphaproteobacteria bacterium]MBU2078803.1 hypothetical protein [Alphaproteobacteria bacterium]MBU2160152.1 hypothetical protein [Alphaproteobacteria bacterium]MBU2243807.1 hypothetical protein [Alphaproteobacteria bacterium]
MRPEVKAMLWRWREVAVALAVVALLGWWSVASFGVMRWIALGFTGLAGIFAVAAVQRARFAHKGDGYGSVEVDEGVVSYFTPYTGGQVEIDAMSSVTLIPAVKGPAHWQFDAPGQPPLLIPLDAFGADRLFDVFVTLDGIETEKMLRQIKQTPDHPVVIWRKRTALLR